MNRKNKKREKMSQPGRRMYSMYARSDRYILRPQVRISGQSQQVSEKSESSTLSTGEFSV